jgi:oligosaccharide repeat unit polymerase
MNIASAAFIIFFLYVFIFGLIDLFKEVLEDSFFIMFFLSSILFFIVFILGMKMDKFKTKKLNLSSFIFVVCLLLYTLSVSYVTSKHGINLLTVFTDFNFKSAEEIRFLVYSEPGFLLLWIEYAPMLVVIYFFQKNTYFGIASFLVIAYVFAAFGSRGHIINLSIFTMTFLYYNNTLRISFWLAPIISLFGVLVLIVLTFIKFGLNHFGDINIAIENSIYRLELGYIQAKQVIELANSTGFEYGWSYIRDLATLLPGSDYGTNKYLSVQIYNTQSYGNLTPTIIGESYLNFGTLSLLILFLYALALIKIDKLIRMSNMFAEFYLLIGLFLVKFLVVGWSGTLPIIVFSIIISLLLGIQRFLLKL